MTNFVHLAGRSQHSRNGLSTPAELVATAVAHGQTALALTDTNLAGALEFRDAAQAVGIKPIIGLSVRVESNGGRLTEIALLAEDHRGWKNLVAINNIAHEAGNHHRQVDYTALREHSAGLIAITTPNAEIDLLDQIFDRDHLLLAANSPDFLRQLREAGSEFSTRIIALPDYRQAKQDDSEARERLAVLRNSKASTAPGAWLFSEDEVLALESDSSAWQSAMHLTGIVSARISNGVIPGPGRFVPGREDTSDIVAELAAAGAARIFGDKSGAVPMDVTRRIGREMESIERTGSARSILVIEDLLNFCAREGIEVGSRGTSSGSLVLYCMGITHVDPLRHGLLMDRLLRPDRDNLIRIDIDIDRERRRETVDYLMSRWPNRVAHTGTRHQVTATNLLRFPDWEPRTGQTTAEALLGRIKNSSISPTGFLISDKALHESVPVRDQGGTKLPVTLWSSDDLAHQGHLVIHLVGSEALAKTAAVAKGAKAAIGREITIPEPWDADPSVDRTWELLASGDTTGIFLVKNRKTECRRIKPRSIEDLAAFVAVFGRQTNTEPYMTARFDGGIPVAMERAGYGSEVVGNILASTNGCILYQEQILQLLTRVGGLSHTEAHAGWVAMAKKRTWEIIDLEKVFASSITMDPLGTPGFDTGEPLAGWLFDRIVEAAPTAFSASHAYAYARTIFRSAWVKANWPVLFDEAVE